MSVREMIRDVQIELQRADDLTPFRASTLELKLAALLGNVLEEIRKADMAYATVYAAHLKAEGKANRAKVFAETTTEFQRTREARDTHAWMVNMVRTLRQYQRTSAEEMRLQR